MKTVAKVRTHASTYDDSILQKYVLKLKLFKDQNKLLDMKLIFLDIKLKIKIYNIQQKLLNIV